MYPLGDVSFCVELLVYGRFLELNNEVDHGLKASLCPSMAKTIALDLNGPAYLPRMVSYLSVYAK